MIPFIINTAAPHQDGILDSFDSQGQGIVNNFVFRDIQLAFYHRPVVPTGQGAPPWQDDWLDTDTFQFTVGNLDEQPTSGTFPIGVLAATITANSIAASTEITTASPHLMVTNDYALIFGSNSTPNIDGLYQITKTGASTFTIAVTVTVAGTAGSVYDATGLNALPWNEAASAFATALNTILTKHSLPNVSGALLSPGEYNFTGTTNGAIPSFYSPTVNALVPQSGVAITVVQAGSASNVAQQVVTLYQAPVAYAEPSTPLPVAALSVSVAQAGDSTHNKVFAIALTAGTYGGTFSCSVTTVSADVFGVIANGGVTASDFQTQLVQATGLSNTDFNVTRVNDVLNVEFAGTQGHDNTVDLIASNIDLLAPLGVSGFINFNTFALFEAFAAASDGTDELTFTMSIRRARASGEQAEYFLVDVLLKRNLVQGVALIPVPLPSFLTEAQSDARYARLAFPNTFTGGQQSFTGTNYPDGLLALDDAGRTAGIGDLGSDNNGTNLTIDDSAGTINVIAGNGVFISVGGLTLADVGKTLSIASGANAKAGTFTLVAGVATVANTSVTANSQINCTVKTVIGTRVGNPDIVPTAGVGFVATGAIGDTSVYNFTITEVA